MKKRMRMVTAVLLSLLMILTLTPAAAFAEGEDGGSAEGAVAKIGDVEYASLDEAVSAVDAGQKIELLSDGQITKMVNKDLYFTGKGQITIQNYTYNGGFNKAFTLDGEDVSFLWEDGSGGWLMFATSGAFNVKNGAKAEFKLDSSKGTNCAMYMNAGASINVEGGSSLTFTGVNTKGVGGQAIQLDKAGTASISVKDGSSFVIDGTNRGYVASPVINVEDSEFTVQNCTSNGSNGGEYRAVNSKINYLNNAGHGLSTTNLVVENSTITANGNGYCGIGNTGKLTVDSSSVIEAKGNGWNNLTGQAALRQGGEGRIASGAKLDVSENYCVGVYVNKAAGSLTVEDGTEVSIMKNGLLTEAGKRLTTTGGGIWNLGAIAMPADAQIYNNHASTAGDDIFSTGSITFGATGADWALDGEPDCEDPIDAWYDDADGSRWEAHDASALHVQKKNAGTYDSAVAVKAAHGVQYLEPEDREWDHSKSKVLSGNLDENYETEVTLSLPSAQEEIATDVVIVADYSEGRKLAQDKAVGLLKNLSDSIEKSNAKINIGSVVFRGAVEKTFDLTEMNEDSLAALSAYLSEKPATAGSNLHAGLLAAKKMLDASDTDDSRKYVLVISDGIVYTWDQDGVQYGASYQGGDQTQTYDNRQFASNTAWEVWKGSLGWVPEEGWDAYLDSMKDKIALTIAERSSVYDRSNIQNPIDQWDRDKYANTVDVALDKSRTVFKELVDAGYNCYSIPDGNASTQYGDSFMKYLAELSGNGAADFDQIENDIYYLLDAGSEVKDYMGYAEGDYDFDFINNIDSIKMKVGDNELEGVEIAENTYGFRAKKAALLRLFGGSDSEYDYVVTYVPGEGTAEHFVWTINVPVNNFEPVSLTYKVKLVNPKEEAGTYGAYDADGSKGEAGLYTNDKAILYPVDSNGEAGAPEAFPKPTVSYTVIAQYTLNYVLNDSEEAPANPSSYEEEVYEQDQNANADRNITGKKPERDGFNFAGWFEDPELTNPVDTDEPIIMTGNRIVYAAWSEKPLLDTENHYAYIIGRTDGMVHPEADITRAEVATIFFRMLTDDSRANAWSRENSFYDVGHYDWFNNAISTLENAGIIGGYEDGTFRPNTSITRAEFVTMAARFFDNEASGATDFTDIDGHWAKEYIQSIYEKGIANGYPDGSFQPDKNISRAEAMTIMNRILKRSPDKDHLLAQDPSDPAKKMIEWPDNMDTSTWYYAQVQEATNSHDYEKFDAYEVWTGIQGVRDWAALEKFWSEANSAK